MERSSEEKVLSGLAHIASIFSWIGVIASVVLLVIYRDKSKFVFGHAKQALGLSAISVVVGLVLGALGVGSGMGLLSSGSLGAAFGTASLFFMLSALWGIVVLILAILAAIKGFNGVEYKHPVIGQTIENIGDKAA
jgi:uncharacterized Tic20 family protein